MKYSPLVAVAVVALTSTACNLATSPSAEPAPLTTEQRGSLAADRVVSLNLVTTHVNPNDQSMTAPDLWLRVETIGQGAVGVADQVVDLAVINGDGRLGAAQVRTGIGGVAQVWLHLASDVTITATHPATGALAWRVPLDSRSQPYRTPLLPGAR